MTKEIFNKTEHRPISKHRIYAAVLVLIVFLSCGLIAFKWHTVQSKSSKATIQNAAIASALRQHPISNLVGQIRKITALSPVVNVNQGLVPLTSCPRVDTASVIDPTKLDYRKSSFAYVLTYDTADQATNMDSKCSLSQVVAAYGRPNASILIAGSLTNPKEVILLYDKGVLKNSPDAPLRPQGPSTVVPIQLSQLLEKTDCGGQTDLNIVAHQDDDLLFLSPDLSRDIKSEKCSRTIYLTAGDAGLDQFYWLSREQGSEVAYSHMTTESDDLWIKRIVKLTDTEFITVATPKTNPKISLIFMHLPDGNFDGSGFKNSNNESLAKLATQRIAMIHSVDKQSMYSSDQLIAALGTLIKYYQPSVIRSQSSERSYKNNMYLDHSDHVTTGLYTKKAYQRVYSNSSGTVSNPKNMVPLYAYIGYPVHGIHDNLTFSDSQEKTQTFLQYAKFDSGVCQSVVDCAKSTTYGSYLKRQYKLEY